MLTMAAAAVYLAIARHQANNIGGGILTFYLIGTAWLTAKRSDGETSAFDWAALLVPLVIGIGGWINGLDAMRTGTGSKYGVPTGMHLFLGTVCLLAAGDVRMLVRGGVFGKKRITRHLWRMCFGLFIATGSFFSGQAVKVFPSLIHETNLLMVLAILPLPLLIFWLLRVRFGNAYKQFSLPRGIDAHSLQT